MSQGFNGQCLCGAVSYESTAPATMLMKCHCRDCQYISGGEAAAIAAVPKDACKILGTLKSYTKTGISGRKVTRKFCPECGTQVLSEAEAQPEMFFFKAGTMDKEAANQLKTAIVLWTDNVHPWTHIDEEAQTFPTQPG